MTIRNLNLQSCNEGEIWADLEFWRGIKEGPNEWNYMKTEKVENVKLGEIGCHNHCMACSDPSELSCLICADTD